MAIVNENAHRGDGGRGGKERGQRFFSYPHFTPFPSRLQPAFLRLGYALRDALLLLAEWVAGRAVKLDDLLWRRGIGA